MENNALITPRAPNKFSRMARQGWRNEYFIGSKSKVSVLRHFNAHGVNFSFLGGGCHQQQTPNAGKPLTLPGYFNPIIRKTCFRSLISLILYLWCKSFLLNAEESL